MFSVLTGLLATTAGKVAVTGAVAAASVGGMHAADVVDVPVLPSNDPVAVEQVETTETTTETESENEAKVDGEELPDEAVAGQATAEEKKAAADGFTQAIRDWTACVSGNAEAQEDEETREEGAFDPREGCDDRPDPHDSGLTETPDQASDEGTENSEDGKANRDLRGDDSADLGTEDSDEDSEEEAEIEETENESDDSDGGPPAGVPPRR